jgi:hydrogenase maturation protease
VLVARRLRELGVDALEHGGEGLGLMASWAGSDDVILIDAVVTGAAAGAIAVWDGTLGPMAFVTRGRTTHAFGVAEAVELARVLGRLPRRLSIYGIEGRRFDLGCAPCAEVAEAVERLARQLAEVWSGPAKVGQALSLRGTPSPAPPFAPARPMRS